VWWHAASSAWRRDGCQVTATSDPLTFKCLCNHLTNFGLLFAVDGGYIPQASSSPSATASPSSSPSLTPDEAAAGGDGPSPGVIAAAIVIPLIVLGAIGAGVFIYLRRTGQLRSAQVSVIKALQKAQVSADSVEMTETSSSDKKSTWTTTDKSQLNITNTSQ